MTTGDSLCNSEKEPKQRPRMATICPWSDLPELVLLAVLHRLPSLLDLFAFAGVCRSWRYILRSCAAAFYRTSRPPLLLCAPVPVHSFGNSSRRPAEGSFHLRSLDPSHGPRLRSLLPFGIYDDVCLGYSHGHLIVVHRDRRELSLLDAFTGYEIRLPLPASNRNPYYYATLTASPASPVCRLLLFFSKYEFWSCCLGGGGDDPNPEWIKRRFIKGAAAHISSILSYKGRFFAVNDQAKLLALEVFPDFKMEAVNVAGLGSMLDYDRWHFGPRLVDLAGELLLVLFALRPGGQRTGIDRIDVYRLDFGELKWVEVEDLGDYCLFIDCVGNCPVLCPTPSGWGGKSNCVYLAAPGCNGWTEYCLRGKTWSIMSVDGRKISVRQSPPSFLSNLSQPRWPSHIWMYPSLFFWSDDMLHL